MPMWQSSTEIPESHRDLIGAQPAVLTTIDKDGYPHSIVVGLDFDDDGQLKIGLTDKRHSYKNLLRHPKCNLLVMDGPWRWLAMRCDIEIEEDTGSRFWRNHLHYIPPPAHITPEDIIEGRKRLGGTDMNIILKPFKVFAMDLSTPPA